jgi:LuxR family maltose regulon positive regulatory protein
VELANVYYAWNDLAQSEVYLEKGLALSEQGGRKLVTQYGRVYQARLLRAKGDPKAALALLEQVERETRQAGISAISVQVDAQLASLRAETGLTIPDGFLEDIDISIGERVGYRQAIRAFQAAHGLIALRRYEQALRLAEDLEAASARCGCTGWQIEALALQAVAAYRLGRSTQAFQSLRQALQLAEPERQTRTFLDLGKVMIEMLQVLPRHGNDLVLVDALLAASGEGLQTAHAAERQPAPLSERELEILRLIAAGCTNQEIADQLVIALGTVKRHTSNIFNKLDVDNRTSAVARAQAMGLI